MGVEGFGFEGGEERGDERVWINIPQFAGPAG